MYQVVGTLRHHPNSVSAALEAKPPEETARNWPDQQVGAGGIGQTLWPGCPISDKARCLSGVRVPLRTRQVTIRAASWLSGHTLWYCLARAGGHTLSLSLEEHASAGTREPYLEAAVRG